MVLFPLPALRSHMPEVAPSYDGRFTLPAMRWSPGRDRGKDIESIRQKLATMRHNRSSLETSLRRAIIAQRREKLKGWPPPRT